MIEKTIIDREMELQINTCMQKESPQGLDYGSYIAHGKIFRKIFYYSLINLESIEFSLLYLFCTYIMANIAGCFFMNQVSCLSSY